MTSSTYRKAKIIQIKSNVILRTSGVANDLLRKPNQGADFMIVILILLTRKNIKTPEILIQAMKFVTSASNLAFLRNADHLFSEMETDVEGK